MAKLEKLKRPCRIGFLSYLGDTQGCGTIRIIHPYLLLNHFRMDGVMTNGTYMMNFIHYPDFYKNFSFVQFQRAATKDHLNIYRHYKNNIQPKLRTPLIYEIDDLLVDIPEWNYACEYYKQNEEYVKQMMSMSDAVVVSTPKLKEIYSKYNKNISVILNHLPKFIWGEIYPKHINNPREKRPRILWAGSQNHFAPKHMHDKGVKGGDFGSTLMDFIRKTTDKYDWCFVGALPIELNDLSDSSKITFTPWKNIFEYPHAIKALEPDICIAPLEDSVFNSCKCIVGDSLVATPNGLKTISDICNKKDKSVRLESYDQNILNYFKYENEKTLKIITKDGFEIEGTYTHEIVNGNNEWKSLDSFEIGDRVKIQKFDIIQSEYQHITYPMLLTKKIEDDIFENSDIDMLPRIIINEKWGRLLGYLIGDGYYNSGNRVSISCDIRYPDIVENVHKLFRGIGLRTFEAKKRNGYSEDNHITRPNGVDIVCSSRNLRKIFEYLGFTGRYGKVLEVPKIILNSPKSVIREFIRGLFEADGGVSVCGCYLSTKSEKLAKQVQILLLGFGIKSKVGQNLNKKYQRYYYSVILNRESSDVFYKEIGFISDIKSNKLKDIVNKDHSNVFKLDDWCDEIVHIEERVNDVYDIEVYKDHYYIANGFKSHNSNIKQLEFTAVGAPGVYSDVEPYKKSYLKAKSDEEMISYIEQLAGDVSFREKVYKKDRQTVAGQLFWEENNNVKNYINTYLKLFGKRL